MLGSITAFRNQILNAIQYTYILDQQSKFPLKIPIVMEKTQCNLLNLLCSKKLLFFHTLPLEEAIQPYSGCQIRQNGTLWKQKKTSRKKTLKFVLHGRLNKNLYFKQPSGFIYTFHLTDPFIHHSNNYLSNAYYSKYYFRC